MSFQLVPKSVTLSDLERRNDHYIMLFQRIGVALFVSDIAIFVLKRDVKLQLTNWCSFRAHYLKVHVRYLIS